MTLTHCIIIAAGLVLAAVILAFPIWDVADKLDRMRLSGYVLNAIDRISEAVHSISVSTSQHADAAHRLADAKVRSLDDAQQLVHRLFGLAEGAGLIPPDADELDAGAASTGPRVTVLFDGAEVLTMEASTLLATAEMMGIRHGAAG